MILRPMLPRRGPLALVLSFGAVVGCGGTASTSGGGAGGPPASAAGPSVSARKPLSWGGSVKERCLAVEPAIREAAARHGLDVGLIAGVIRVESTFRPDVRSGAGAVGLMQVMPANGRNLRCGSLTEPRPNIDCGVRVLKRFLEYYRGDLVYALSAYNAGWSRPNTARAGSTTPTNFGYVENVLAARTAYLRDGCGR